MITGTETSAIYTLSLHDALPIFAAGVRRVVDPDNSEGRSARREVAMAALADMLAWFGDRKSTRLNSSHSQISYAVFCLKKKINEPVRSTARSNAQHHLPALLPLE